MKIIWLNCEMVNGLIVLKCNSSKKCQNGLNSTKTKCIYSGILIILPQE